MIFSPSLTKTAYDNIKYIAFRDTYGSADANYYYQQRWNAHDQEDAPLVREVLGEVEGRCLETTAIRTFPHRTDARQENHSPHQWGTAQVSVD